MIAQYGFAVLIGSLLGFPVGWAVSRVASHFKGPKCPTCGARQQHLGWAPEPLIEEKMREMAPLWAALFCWKMQKLGYPPKQINRVGRYLIRYSNRLGRYRRG